MEQQKKNCNYTKFRKVSPCVCDENCPYHIKCEKSGNCAIDFSNEGGHTLEEVANALDYTIAGIVLVENRAISKIKKMINEQMEDCLYD